MRTTSRLALFAFCLLSGSRWIISDAFPSTLPQQAVHLAVLTAIFALISRRLPRKPLELASLAVLLLAFPLAAFALAEGHITPYTQTVVFTFVPAVVVFVITQQTQVFGPDPSTRALFPPALAGVVGALLLIPVTLPTSLANQLRLALVVVAMFTASLAGIRLHKILAGDPILPAAAVISGTCAVSLGLLSLHQHITLLPQDLLPLALDAASLLLTLFLIRELHPIPASTRFLLIPLITILEGLLFLRPQLSLAMAAGILLLAFACIVLLRSRIPETV